MAQTMLAKVLRHYHILAPNTPEMIELTDEFMRELELIPQGIPALYEYSERFARDHRRTKKLVNAFINLTSRHRGRFLDVRFAPLIVVLVYLSRPMINFVLSSVWETTGRISQLTAPRPHSPNYVTKATQTCSPIPGPSAESDSEKETVIFTIAEMLWMENITTGLLRNEKESKIRQADMLTAIGDLEDENEALRDNISNLEKQHALDQNNQRRLYNERESYRLGGKDFKEKWENLQKEYNDLEDDRDELSTANGLLKIENEELEAKAAIDKDAAAEYEEVCEDLNKDLGRQTRELDAAAKKISEQKEELQEAAKETADLKAQLAAVSAVRWEGLDDFESDMGTEEPKELKSAIQATGSQVGLKEDTLKLITQPMTVEQSKVEIRKLKKELDELKAVHNAPEPSRNTWRGAIFEQPQGLSNNNIEEGTPLRRIQSAPLWLPLSHHDDTFDSLFDGSDYGDDDDHDDDTGDEDHDEGKGDQDDDHASGDDNVYGSDQYQTDENDHISGNDNRDRSSQDVNNDDVDDRRDGGARKIVLKEYQTRQDQVGDTTPLPEDIPLLETPPNNGQVPIIPEPSPRRVSPNLNVAAPVFVPAHRSSPPIPFRAMGPEDTKNDHVKKINEGLKRREWAEKSGKPDLVEGKEGVAVAEEVIDDMYDRQITQFLNPSPIRYARGSMWGALNDVPNRLDDVSIPTNKDDDANEASAETQRNLDVHSTGSQEDYEEQNENNGEWSDVEDEDHEENDGVMPTLGRYQVTRRQNHDQNDDARPMPGNYKVTRGPEPINNSSKECHKKPRVDTQKKIRSTTTAHRKSGSPKEEAESEAAADWTDVEDGTDKEIQDEDSPEEKGVMPMLGKYNVTRGDTPSDSDHETSEAEKKSGHDSSPPMACGTSTEEMSRQDVTTPVRVLQSAGSSTSDSDATNQIGDAALSQAPPQDVTTPVRVPQSVGPSTSDSDTTDQPDVTAVSQAPPQGQPNPTTVPKPQPPPGAPTGPRAHKSRNPSPKPSDSDLPTSIINKPDTTPKVLLPTPRQCGIDNQDPTPRVRLPHQPIRNQPPPAPVTPSTRTCSQEELDSSTSPQPAIFRQPPQTLDPPSTPANRGSPSRDVSAASRSRSDNSGIQNGNRAPPTGPAAGVPQWSPRGNARGGRGGRGAPARNVPPNTLRTGSPTLVLGSGTQGPGFNVRDGDGGNGRQQGPVKGSIPRGPAASTNTITNNNNTPSRQSGRGRGSGSAADSFQRFQERMAMEKGS